MRYDVTDFEWSLIEQLLPRNRRASNPNVIGNAATERTNFAREKICGEACSAKRLDSNLQCPLLKS
jgi:hypothetical protein